MICGITTSPRPDGISYLEKTIESLWRTGRAEMRIFAEPESTVPDCRELLVIRNEQRLGNWYNWKKCASACLNEAKTRGEKYVITCEDDVVFHRDAIYYADFTLDSLVKECGIDSVGFLSLYSSSIYQRQIENGVHPLPAKSLLGACALAWPIEPLEAVLSHKIADGWRGLTSPAPSKGSPEICHADTCIGECLHRLGKKMFFCKPCFAQHIGEVSSLRKVALTPERQASHVSEEK